MEVYWTRAMEQFEAWLRTWSPSGKRVALVFGPVGSGKTTTIRHVAAKNGYEVVEPESVEVAFHLAKTSSFMKIVIHLDRPYELGFTGKKLSELAKATRHPVAIEDTEDMRKYYQHLLPAEVRVVPPKAQVARAAAKSALVKPRFRDTSDMRQLLYAGIGADAYREEGWLERLERFLRTGAAEGLEDSHIPALLDTFATNCYGLECVEAIALLVAADYSKRLGVLEGFRLSRKLVKPTMYFYERWKAANLTDRIESRALTRPPLNRSLHQPPEELVWREARGPQ